MRTDKQRKQDLSIKWYKIFQKQFEWKSDAKKFTECIKIKARIAQIKIHTDVLPEYKIRGTESRIMSYFVRWWYIPIS